MSGAGTVCEWCGQKISMGWYDHSGVRAFVCENNPGGNYSHAPRTPETQGVRIPEKWRPVYERHVALLDTDSLHICMLAEELGHAESRSRAILGLLRVKHPRDVALAEEIIDEGGR